MTTLEQDLKLETNRLVELRARAQVRLEEAVAEAGAVEAKVAQARESGDDAATAACERRAQKLRVQARRYTGLVNELDEGGERLAAEVLLARLQGPEVDLLVGEVDRNRELIIQRATALLTARDRQRTLRQRWGELNDKIRKLRSMHGLRAPARSAVDFRITLTPASYEQKPDGPTFREVSDLIHGLGL